MPSKTLEREAVAREWAARGFSCDIWIDPPGQVWADFVHDTDELVMPIEGDVEFEIDSKVFRPAPGEEFLIPAGATHTVRTGVTGSRWFYGYRRG